MRYSAIIFDLDGTLLDTLEDLAEAANRTLAHHGLPTHPVSRYRYFVGDGLQSLIKRILPQQRRDAETMSRLSEDFRRFYQQNWNRTSSPYQGINTMLTALQNQQIPLAVLSNKPHTFTEICVQEWFAPHCFSLVRGQHPDQPRKPDPTGALEIAAHLGVAPGCMLFVGDTAVDMQTAVRAGMDGAGVLWGFRSAEELRDNGARYLVSRPAEILSLVAGH